MAGKNQVVLTFAGDSKALEKSFDNIGASSKKMDDDVRKGGKSLDDLGEKADNGETRILGLKDSVDGVATVMQGPGKAGIAAYIQGWADIASGIANFIIPALSAMVAKLGIGTAATEAQTVANAELGTSWLAAIGPILLVIAAIAALVAIGYVIIRNWGTIKEVAAKVWEFILNAVKGVFNWIKTNWPLVLAIITGPIGLAVLAIVRHWDTIKNGFAAAMRFVKDMATNTKTWIVNAFDSVVRFFTGLPGRVRGIFSSLGSSIVNGFKALWNNTIGGFGFSFGGFDPPGPGKIPGFDFRIPYLADGGVITRPTLALVGEAGPEAVVPLGRGGGMGMTVNVYVQGSIHSERDLVKVIRNEIERGGFR